VLDNAVAPVPGEALTAPSCHLDFRASGFVLVSLFILQRKISPVVLALVIIVVEQVLDID
jgi:hypothetical protein